MYLEPYAAKPISVQSNLVVINILKDNNVNLLNNDNILEIFNLKDRQL